MRMTILMHKPLLTLTGVKEHHARRSTDAIPVPQVNQSLGRRSLLTSSFLAFAAAFPEASDSRSALLQKYLKKSQENKAKNDKERLEDFYKRNYKDYFEFIEGTLKGKTEGLTESEKGILDWLQRNRKQ